MKLYYTKTNTDRELYRLLKERAGHTSADIQEKVAAVLENVRTNGDKALFAYSETFDRVRLERLELTKEDIEKQVGQVSPELLGTLKAAARNIRLYHEKQLSSGYEISENGKTLGRLVRPLERVGVYVPGGTAAYPSTVLMNCIPASVAGVREIILVTPPKAEGISPAVVAAAQIAGVSRIFTIGGAQAIAALAYGTESVPQVDKIVGPGNMFVAEAKRQVFGKVDIDMIAGPSEVCVVTDGSANPTYLAADFLSQLEHDRAASATLICQDLSFAKKVEKEIERQLSLLPRREIAAESFANYSAIVVTESLEESFRVANRIAPEHLEIVTDNPYEHMKMVENAGSIFLGEYTPEPMGDYFAGTNHVLPTSGTARFSSPLSVDDFIKKMSYLSYTRDAFLREADDVIRFAECEGLDAHARSVSIRKETGKV
ncbi:MAG: histidinol dehydrogenase [Clostridia bacterium]|nr:histidinol dehydrogenase [Clostridia bacterium]